MLTLIFNIFRILCPGGEELFNSKWLNYCLEFTIQLWKTQFQFLCLSFIHPSHWAEAHMMLWENSGCFPQDWDQSVFTLLLITLCSIKSLKENLKPWFLPSQNQLLTKSYCTSSKPILKGKLLIALKASSSFPSLQLYLKIKLQKDSFNLTFWLDSGTKQETPLWRSRNCSKSSSLITNFSASLRASSPVFSPSMSRHWNTWRQKAPG